MRTEFSYRPGRASLRDLVGLMGLVLAAVGLSPAPARADFGCAESNVFPIINAGCEESDVFTIDNSSCGESLVFVIDNRPVNADFDHDGDVDLHDLAAFQLCFSGSGVMYRAGCADADLNHDGDVDQDDFGRFQQYFCGPREPRPSPENAGHTFPDPHRVVSP